ncbi:M48 family metallopeptidase, partial [Streptomyces sp. TRM76130]|nr:M48 family metallopeptidase [Streptomyces sp. TRM76130]
PGLPVTEADEPALWRTVRELADQVGTRAPSRIALTPDVNAAVSEDARLLGLLPGPRRLYLGVPLLQGLTEAQLRSVLAHELGHYSNADTRLAALTARGRA